MAKIYGGGFMWVPGIGHMLEFTDGIIESDDPIVIACAGINGFRVVNATRTAALPELPEPVKKLTPKVKAAVK